jgi:DNA invertase Pin-like site-specific DNA recombinase
MLVGYSRVSTTDQDPALQVDALVAAGCQTIITERGSGYVDRPELNECLRNLREGDCLVVWRLDRLGRSIRQLIDTLEELEQRKIAFRSLTEAIDTSSPGGRLVFHIFGALAEFERSLIIQRTMAGLAAAKAKGRVGGRPRALIRSRYNRRQSDVGRSSTNSP